MQQCVDQGVWPGRTGSKTVRSDAEAFFPAIDVTESQVDICANALQGLQLKGTTKVLRIGP